MNRVKGKVAFITGAARGQGRNHALRLAAEGADIIAVDICHNIDSAQYDLGTPADLEETVRQVEALGRRVVARQADVRDVGSLRKAFEEGRAELGAPDIVVANAGIAVFAVEESPDAWRDTIDVNLTGVFNTLETAIPSMVDADKGGSIVLVSSTAGLRGILGSSHAALGYVASKHGVVGLMRSYANNLAPHSIRVNSLHPTGVDTKMITADSMGAFVNANPNLAADVSNPMPVGLIDVQDVTNALLYLVSEDGRYVTGTTLPVDGGFANKK